MFLKYKNYSVLIYFIYCLESAWQRLILLPIILSFVIKTTGLDINQNTDLVEIKLTGILIQLIVHVISLISIISLVQSTLLLFVELD